MMPGEADRQARGAGSLEVVRTERTVVPVRRHSAAEGHPERHEYGGDASCDGTELGMALSDVVHRGRRHEVGAMTR